LIVRVAAGSSTSVIRQAYGGPRTVAVWIWPSTTAKL
jgi:hypothetical protein